MADRYAVVEISQQLLCSFMRYGTGMVEVIENPLPADARIVRVFGSSYAAEVLTFVVESQEFAEVPMNTSYPRLPAPVFRDARVAT
jgi:hypothetical protein